MKSFPEVKGGSEVRMKNTVAIVTGGGRGIGEAICRTLGKEGADVAVADINMKAAENVAEEMKSNGIKAISVEMDVSDSASVAEGVRKVQELLGPIDVLVNNAGWDRLMPFVESDESLWNRIIGINLLGPLHCTKAVLRGMIEIGRGKIVNIGSDAGRVGSTGEAVYSAAKGGIIAFTKTLAREVARYGVTVNCVCPGPTDTPQFQEIAGGGGNAEKLVQSLAKQIPMRRIGQPEDIANAVLFLASDESSFVTGQTLSVSGGMTMC